MLSASLNKNISLSLKKSIYLFHQCPAGWNRVGSTALSQDSFQTTKTVNSVIVSVPNGELDIRLMYKYQMVS